MDEGIENVLAYLVLPELFFTISLSRQPASIIARRPESEAVRPGCLDSSKRYWS
jgi:hypothetical protein